MDNLDHKFGELTGRKATPKELELLRRTKDTLHLSDNDALWPILILFQSQVTSIATTANQMEQTAERYQNAIQDAGTKVEKIMKGAQSASRRVRTDKDAGDSKDFRMVPRIVFLILLLFSGIWSYGKGEENAILKVCEYSIHLAANLFDGSDCEEQ